MFNSMHLLAILIAAIVGFLVSVPWYSQLMFGRLWLQETGLTEEQCK